MIFISSDFTEIVNLCDSIVVLRDRRTVAEFRNERVTERALLDACYPEPELSAGDAGGVSL